MADLRFFVQEAGRKERTVFQLLSSSMRVDAEED